MNPERPPSSIRIPDLRGWDGHAPWLMIDPSSGLEGPTGMLAAGIRRSLTLEDASPEAFDQVAQFVGAAQGRCLGWIGYDQLRGDAMLDLPPQPPSAVALPVVHWIEPEALLAFGPGPEDLHWLRVPKESALVQAMERAVHSPLDPGFPRTGPKDGGASSSLGRPEYLQAFEQVHQHILRGDLYELNLCRELSGDLPEGWRAEAAFAQLVTRTSAPYSAWLQYGDCRVLCASPECFLQKEGRRLVSRPIKGTASRHAQPEQDAWAAERLRTDRKERAENVMITDLVRNDLSRVADPASVEVEELCGIHSFRNVHQMISTVACRVREDAGFAEIMRATFPMGSMTGAPKLRAMEITADVEPVRRGLYSGALGWADPDGAGGVGDFHFNVIIRTVLADLATGRWSAHVGGAITALAHPEGEWEETCLKARALLEVVGAKEATHPETECHG